MVGTLKLEVKTIDGRKVPIDVEDAASFTPRMTWERLLASGANAQENSSPKSSAMGPEDFTLLNTVTMRKMHDLDRSLESYGLKAPTHPPDTDRSVRIEVIPLPRSACSASKGSCSVVYRVKVVVNRNLKKIKSLFIIEFIEHVQ